MADQLLFTRDIPHKHTIQQDRQAIVRSAISARAFLRFVLGVGTIAAVILVFEYAIVPKVPISSYSIASDLGVPDATILQAAGLDGTQYYFKLNVKKVAERLNSWAPVKHATVRKVFPHGLKISIVGRKPVGMAMAEVDGREVPVAFDADGVVFTSGQSVADLDLPVFSGIKFKNFVLGVKLPAMLLNFVRQVQELKLSSPGLYDLISEYRIVPRNDHEFDVILYPIHYHVAVEINPHIDRALCMYILRALDVMNREGAIGKVKEIDFRTSDVVYTMNKEG